MDLMNAVMYVPGSGSMKRLGDLAAVRKAISGRPVRAVQISNPGGTAELTINFENGGQLVADASSFRELCAYLLRWRNLANAPLFSNGDYKERITSNNAYLKRIVDGTQLPVPAQRYYPENRMRMPGGPARRVS